MSSYICNSNKYTLGGQTGDTIALPVDIRDLPETIEIEGNNLICKSTFHVSLICIGRIIEKYGIQIPGFVDLLVNDFCEFIKTNDVYLMRYSDEFRFVEHGDRKSLVVMCEVSNLQSFFDFINKKYSLSIEYQTTHVSLYTLEKDKAIFLVDSSDISELTRVVTKPDAIPDIPVCYTNQ